jgi:hypothetical protein
MQKKLLHFTSERKGLNLPKGLIRKWKKTEAEPFYFEVLTLYIAAHLFNYKFLMAEHFSNVSFQTSNRASNIVTVTKKVLSFMTTVREKEVSS